MYGKLLKKQGFNRSLDIWSVGVIIYVSLSGQFPFNEDIDIRDQIKDAQFMYPSKPWKNISNAAKCCIKGFLVVKREQRNTVNQALQDPWLVDKICVDDLASLEKEVHIFKKKT